MTGTPAHGDDPGPLLCSLAVAGHTVAEYRAGDGLDPKLAPRPVLHPMRTLGGTVVTDWSPPDHPWHLGLSVAVQDVDGVNFWGGQTFVRDQGYMWREDHGRVGHVGWTGRDSRSFAQELSWLGPDGGERLRESREVRAASASADAWMLDMTYTLRNIHPWAVALGSPATNGRPGAGYGGFFWRISACHEVTIRDSNGAEGESAVHGSVSAWLSFAAQTVGGAPFTLIFAGGDAVTRRDPWFVRATGYQGVCSALAFVDPLVLSANSTLTRRIRVLIADGRPDPRQLAQAVML